ncbi:MAG TPA: TIGR03862 family flavoprotein, partial [Nitrosopumilaceae archaeon]|nr:TIGR03862 family flavoprotein [Nitrosopumilaceae archaeon]
GGFNLTHSENVEQLICRYTPSSIFEKPVPLFSNEQLRNRLSELGIPTFIGTSKRVFPEKGIKPIDVLNAFLKELERKKVKIYTRHKWKGWGRGTELVFDVESNEQRIHADIVVFALGGASWKVSGSDGNWSDIFAEKGIDIIPFEASNCNFLVDWPPGFIIDAEGTALKNIAMQCGLMVKKGEVVITKQGIEGGAIYALSPAIRKQLKENKKAEVSIDLKPLLEISEIKKRLENRKGNKAWGSHVETVLKLNKVHLNLLRYLLNKTEFTDPLVLAQKIKNLPLTISGMAPIDEAISTVGGISLNEVDEYFNIKKLSHQYAIGEMLDWDAPTGGYLLQGCFSMAAYLAGHLNNNYQGTKF